MDWKKMLNDMSVLTERPIPTELLMFAMYLDLYNSTTNWDLKQAMERIFIGMFNAMKLD